MDQGIANKQWRALLCVCGLVLLLRLPFLNQPIQGDDVYYLAAAEHAQIEPLHPNHATVAFLGKMVSLRGHPHPPLNGWALGGLLALVGDVREVPFHAAYVVFSLIATLAMWSLAKRFSPQPLWATLLFLATPAFVVNGNSLESDLPLLAFWMASSALFVRAVDRKSAGWLAASVLCMVLAAMAAMQAVFLVPILGFYLWQKRRSWKAGWLAILAAPGALILWQLWEQSSGGALPASELANNFQQYDFQNLKAKLKSAVALTVHSGWIVFPPLAWWAFREVGMIGWIIVGIAAVAGAVFDPNPLFWVCFATGVLALFWCARRWREFEAAWILLFMAGAMVIFFSGSARYLLPMAAPVAILVSKRSQWLAAGFALQLTLALCLSWVNFEHWNSYRQSAGTLPKESDYKRVWINGEWGLQYYGEARGGLSLMEGQAVLPGEYIVSSALGYPTDFTTGGGLLTSVSELEIRPTLPLRLIGLDSKSAYSTAGKGLRAFDVSTAPVDRVKLGVVVERQPTLTDLPMNSSEAESHIVSGIYQLEGRTRWMSGRATVLLKRPEAKSILRATFYIPDQAPARSARILLDGKEVASEQWTGPGMRTLKSGPIAVGPGTANVAIILDKTFQIQNDRRELGAVLVEVGFVLAP